MRIGLLVATLCLIAADSPDPAIDGKSLAGWNYLPAHWKVEGGRIVGQHDGTLKFNTFLCSQRSYRDFELQFRVKLTGAGANSGVQVRSTVSNREQWKVRGPQADIGAVYWGSLYGEDFGGMMKACDFAKVKPTLKADDFNDYFVRVVGKRVTIRVNDVTTVDQEFEKLPAEGIIALQLHQGPKMQVEYEKIRLAEVK